MFRFGTYGRASESHFTFFSMNRTEAGTAHPSPTPRRMRHPRGSEVKGSVNSSRWYHHKMWRRLPGKGAPPALDWGDESGWSGSYATDLGGMPFRPLMEAGFNNGSDGNGGGPGFGVVGGWAGAAAAQANTAPVWQTMSWQDPLPVTPPSGGGTGGGGVTPAHGLRQDHPDDPGGACRSKCATVMLNKFADCAKDSWLLNLLCSDSVKKDVEDALRNCVPSSVGGPGALANCLAKKTVGWVGCQIALAGCRAKSVYSFESCMAVCKMGIEEF